MSLTNQLAEIQGQLAALGVTLARRRAAALKAAKEKAAAKAKAANAPATAEKK